jgi:hypothetical protein
VIYEQGAWLYYWAHGWFEKREQEVSSR